MAAQQKRRTRVADYILHLTVAEVALLRRHAPEDSFDQFLAAMAVTDDLATFTLADSALDDFLRFVEATGNNAQSIEDGERLGNAYVRVVDGLNDTADRGLHLVRPAAAALGYSVKQGQYLAFIYYYLKLHRRAPSEAELQAYFRVTPPSVHGMLKTLERRGFIKRTAGVARSIVLLLRPDQISALD
jgi:repressor LexA